MKPFPAAEMATCPVFAAALHRAKTRLAGSRFAATANRMKTKSAKLARILTTTRPKPVRKAGRS